MHAKKYKVVGIGNAIVDVLVNVGDDFLKKHNLRKGAMRIVDEFEIEKLYSSVKAIKQVSGGSAANTIAALASLGNPVAFIGRVGDDILGRVFEEDLKSLGVEYCISKKDCGRPTACCVVLTTPDAQRTMNTFLGVSGYLGPDDINGDVISQSKITYLEGYLWDSKEARRAFEKAIRIASETGGKISLSLSDSFCVERHRDEFLNLIRNHVDILFGNEEEIKSLFKTRNIKSALSRCAEFKKIWVITRSEKGSIVLFNGKENTVPAEKNVKIIDTTGAGDLYAAGFLHGFARGMSPEKCGRMGSVIAAEIISQFGARLETSLIKLLDKRAFYF